MSITPITTTTTIVDNILNYWLDLREDKSMTPEARSELMTNRLLAQPQEVQDAFFAETTAMLDRIKRL